MGKPENPHFDTKTDVLWNVVMQCFCGCAIFDSTAQYQEYKHAWQGAAGILKGEQFHAWFAVRQDTGHGDGTTIQLPHFVNTPLEVLISLWLATKEAWDKRVATRALEGKLLTPKAKEKFDSRTHL